MQRRTLLKAFALSASTVLMGYSFQVYAADTIKVGIMHSLSGTMAISETPLKDVALMAIDDINAKGGVNGNGKNGVVLFALHSCSCRSNMIMHNKTAIIRRHNFETNRQMRT